MKIENPKFIEIISLRINYGNLMKNVHGTCGSGF